MAAPPPPDRPRPRARRRTTATIAAVLALGGATASTAAGAAPSTPARASATAQVADNGRPLLQLGDRGQSVAAWQRQLNLLTGTDLAVDGIYGTSTEMATMDFQRFFGLRVDGIVGESTRGLMRYLLAITRDYTPLAAYETFQVATFSGDDGGQCVEVLSGDALAVECGPVPPSPLSAQTIAVTDDQLVLVGYVGPSIDRIVVETDGGAEVPVDDEAPVPGTDREAWTTPIDPSEVLAVRALAGDGSEVRRVVVDGGDAVLVLERGDRGPAVADWQAQLNEGIEAGLAVDGVFGESTVTATRNLQRFFGLTVDGIVGPQTRELMQFVLLLRQAG